MGALKHRAAPIAVLQRLQLVIEIIPLSNYYFKVRLAKEITPGCLRAALVAFNDSVEDPVFHSIFDGTSTDILQAPRPSFRPGFRPRAAPPTFVVLERPPKSLTLEFATEFGAARGLDSPTWATSPRGTCIVWSCPASVGEVDLCFSLSGVSYRAARLTRLPKDITCAESDPEVNAHIDSIFRGVFDSLSNELPESFLAAISRAVPLIPLSPLQTGTPL